jgi:hypothetical protein
MNDTTTTTESAADRGDTLTRADEAFGDQIEAFARTEGLPPAIARAIRRNAVQHTGDGVIDARRITEAAHPPTPLKGGEGR